MSDLKVPVDDQRLGGCHILKYIEKDDRGTMKYYPYSITYRELDAIPPDMHTYVCNKTIQFGAHCLIVVHTDENNSKIHTLYEMPTISDQTNDYINMWSRQNPDVKGVTIYAYFN
jgi:hypothetical protein